MGLSSSYFFICSSFCLYFYAVSGFNDSFIESLDAHLYKHAIQSMFHGKPHTGKLYNASLPASLAGMKFSAVRVRSRTLWRLGANFSNFHIPSQSLAVPSARRLLIIYHDFKNWSSSYDISSGYALQTSVIGFMIYDASNLQDKKLIKLNISTMGSPIVIQFPDSVASNQQGKCAMFGADGRVLVSNMVMANVCYSTKAGHFAIILSTKKQRKKRLGVWIVGLVLGIFGMVLLGLLIRVMFRVMRMKRSYGTEREDDEETLQTICLDRSKLPRASFTRTQPVLEDSGPP